MVVLTTTFCNLKFTIFSWSQELWAIQCFLEFANNYCQFIFHLTELVPPRTAFTKKGNNTRNWTNQAKAAFQQLKVSFASASLPHHPDPSRPFFLEGDTSSIGVGADPSYRNDKDKDLLFFSPRHSVQLIRIIILITIFFSSSEAVVPSVGAMFTDHKNLLYLQTTNHLNPWQARSLWQFVILVLKKRCLTRSPQDYCSLCQFQIFHGPTLLPIS